MSLAERPEGGDFPDAPLEVSLISTLRDDAIKIIANQGNDSIGYIIPKAQYDVVRPRAYYEDGQYGEDNSVGGKCGAVGSRRRLQNVRTWSRPLEPYFSTADPTKVGIEKSL